MIFSLLFFCCYSDLLRLLVWDQELVIRPFMLEERDFNILLPGDVVAPKCPRSELLLEFTTLRPVRPGVVRVKYEIVIGHTGYDTRDRFLGNYHTVECESLVSRLAIPGNY